MLLDTRLRGQSYPPSPIGSSTGSKLSSQLVDEQATVETMLLDGMSVNLAAKITRLPIEQIEQIKNNLAYQ